MFEKKDIPDNWELLEISDVIENAKNGGTPKRSNDEYWGGNVDWLSSGELKGKEIHTAEETINKKALNESSAKLFPENSVLVAMYGATRGQSAILRSEMSGNQAICCLELDANCVIPEYVFYYLQHIKRELVSEGRGGGQKNINQGIIKEQKIPVPPVDQQESIVNKIEELFSMLDAGVGELKEAKQRLDQYRGAVLHTALVGKLTQEWREENKGTISGNRITSADPDGDAPQLPSSWEWVQFESVLRESLRNGHSAKEADEGIRTLTLTAVTQREFSEENTKITEANPEKVEDLWLESGDLLIERSNTEEYVGLPAVYRGEENYAIYPDLMIRARVDESLVIPEYADYMLLSPYLRNYLRNKSKGTSGSMSKINQKHIKNIPFPLAPIEEQSEIVQKLEQIISVVREEKQNIETELNRAENLRQSVLRVAFEGRFLYSNTNKEATEQLRNSEKNTTKVRQNMEQATLSEVTNDAE